MSKQANRHDSIEECFMYVCFGLAFVAGSVVAIALNTGDGLSELRDSLVGIGLGASGLWFALGVFLYQDRKRKEADEDIKAQLREILDRLDERESECRAQCCGEADAQELQRRSWLFGLLCSSARR